MSKLADIIGAVDRLDPVWPWGAERERVDYYRRAFSCGMRMLDIDKASATLKC